MEKQRAKGHCEFVTSKRIWGPLLVRLTSCSRLGARREARARRHAKDRLIWDLSRSEVNEAVSLGERIGGSQGPGRNTTGATAPAVSSSSSSRLACHEARALEGEGGSAALLSACLSSPVPGPVASWVSGRSRGACHECDGGGSFAGDLPVAPCAGARGQFVRQMLSARFGLALLSPHGPGWICGHTLALS